MGLLDPPAVTRSQVRTAPIARTYGSPEERGDMAFTRYNGGAPLFSVSTQQARTDAVTPKTSGTLYWLWLVHARKVLGAAAKDEYYLYWSTDHTTDGTDGIYMATGPTPAGPFLNYGRVFQDNFGSALSTETPSVMWDEPNNRFIMYYQVQNAQGAVGTQSTCYATSANGLNWTRGGISVDIPAGSTFPGDGHTGYFRPFQFGNRWFAYHLMGGQNFSRTGISQSNDGIVWDTDPRPLLQAVDQLPDGQRWAYNGMHIIQWRGQMWAICTRTNVGSGGGSRVAAVAAAPMCSDLRHFIGTPRVLLTPQGLETENLKSHFPYVDPNGRLWLLYQTDENVFAAYID